MEILIDQHTLERAAERGTSEDEIEEVIRTGLPMQAKYGRLCKAKVFEFRGKRHRKYFEQKRVEVVYRMESNSIFTITVYVFYGKWEE